jgi:hypothetical protein
MRKHPPASLREPYPKPSQGAGPFHAHSGAVQHCVLRPRHRLASPMRLNVVLGRRFDPPAHLRNVELCQPRPPASGLKRCRERARMRVRISQWLEANSIWPPSTRAFCQGKGREFEPRLPLHSPPCQTVTLPTCSRTRSGPVSLTTGLLRRCEVWEDPVASGNRALWSARQPCISLFGLRRSKLTSEPNRPGRVIAGNDRLPAGTDGSESRGVRSWPRCAP